VVEQPAALFPGGGGLDLLAEPAGLRAGDVLEADDGSADLRYGWPEQLVGAERGEVRHEGGCVRALGKGVGAARAVDARGTRRQGAHIDYVHGQRGHQRGGDQEVAVRQRVLVEPPVAMDAHDRRRGSASPMNGRRARTLDPHRFASLGAGSCTTTRRLRNHTNPLASPPATCASDRHPGSGEFRPRPRRPATRIVVPCPATREGLPAAPATRPGRTDLSHGATTCEPFHVPTGATLWPTPTGTRGRHRPVTTPATER
jgi:hypothetical protein